MQTDSFINYTQLLVITGCNGIIISRYYLSKLFCLNYHQPVGSSPNKSLRLYFHRYFSPSSPFRVSAPHQDTRSSVPGATKGREKERHFNRLDKQQSRKARRRKKRRRIRRTWSKRIYIKATGAQLRDVISFLNIRRDSCVCHKSSARETTDKNIRARHKRTTSKTNTVLSLIHVINWIH